MVDKLTDKFKRETREDIAKLLGLDVTKVTIGENLEMGFYLKIDASERKMTSVSITRQIMHYLLRLETLRKTSLVIKV
jgi:hypothetical protein